MPTAPSQRRADAAVTAVLLVAAACGGAAVPNAHVIDVDVEDLARASSSERWYELAWQGARVGWATTRESRSERGVTVVHAEHLRLRRGADLVDHDVTIEVSADAALHPRTIAIVERDSGGGELRRELGWTERGWRMPGVESMLRADAIPSELVPLLVRRDGGFDGWVTLPGRGFAVGRATVVATGPRQHVARTILEGGTLETVVEVDAAGELVAAVDSSGVTVRAAPGPDGIDVFALVDVIALGQLELEGIAPPGLARLTIMTTAARAPLDDSPPGQRVDVERDAWQVELDGRLPGSLPALATGPDRTDEIASLAARIEQELTPSLGASGLDPTAATAGDCTIYALRFAGAAIAAGIPTHLVTGYRLEAATLTRHRWAVTWTGTRWIAVDASLGEAPASPRLLGLAIHDTTTADLATSELAFAGLLSARWR